MHASAYATAMPRAPDGTRTRTAEACSTDVSHCRLSPTGNSFGRLAPMCDAVPSVRRSRRSITTRRTCARCSRAPASGAQRSCARMLQDGKLFPGVGKAELLRAKALPLRTAETKRPRVLRPEGVRVASGDRGGRSPRESGRDQVFSASGYRMPSSHARRPAPWRDGHRANRFFALAKIVDMEFGIRKKRRSGGRRARYSRHSSVATGFSHRDAQTDERSQAWNRREVREDHCRLARIAGNASTYRHWPHPIPRWKSCCCRS